MQVIVNKSRLVSLFSNDISKEYDGIYRLSNFLIFDKCDDGYLVYNTLTKIFLLLSNDEYEEINNPLNLDCPNKDFFIQNLLWVPVDFNEIEFYRQLRDFIIKVSNADYIDTFTVLTTTKCNARCFYCFERGCNQVDMTEETAIELAEFMIKKSNGRKINIKWFGGEPLCNFKIIDIISNYFKERNIKYSSKMVSNAYLFDENIVNKAKELWNLGVLQISLDGTEKVYNRVKNYIDVGNESPFVRVINNIALLAANGIKVSIRLNMDIHNKDDLFELSEFLMERFKCEPNVKIYPKLLFDNTDKLQQNRSNEDRAYLYGELERLENILFDNDKFMARKLSSEIIPYFCSAADVHSVTVLPDGRLGLCDTIVGTESCGNIKEGITDWEEIASYNELQPYTDECKKCNILPMCARTKRCPFYIRACEDYSRDSERRLILYSMRTAYKKWKSEK